MSTVIDQFEGLRNVRDLGGAVTGDGSTVSCGHILRSGSLHALSSQDIQVLQSDYQLSLVIDLRTVMEREQLPDIEIPGCTSLHCPLFQEQAVDLTREKGIEENELALPDLAKLYRFMVSDETSVSQLSRAVKAIIGCETGGVLYNCTAGKDRMGIVSMLVYGMLGVSETQIMEDYLMSNETASKDAEALSENILKKTGNRMIAEGLKKAFLADSSYLQSALDYIHSEYGNIVDYCRDALQISEPEQAQFRTRLLIPAEN